MLKNIINRNVIQYLNKNNSIKKSAIKIILNRNTEEKLLIKGNLTLNQNRSYFLSSNGNNKSIVDYPTHEKNYSYLKISNNLNNISF